MWLGQAAKIPYVGQATGLGAGTIARIKSGLHLRLGIHYIDVAQWGGGHDGTGPVEIEGRGVAAKGGFNNCLMTWNVNLTYADGVRLNYSNDGGPNPHGVRFEGTKGWLFVCRGGFDANPKSLLKEEPARRKSTSIPATSTPTPQVHPHPRGNGLLCRDCPPPTLVCHLANIACLTGRKPTGDPAKERFWATPRPTSCSLARCRRRGICTIFPLSRPSSSVPGVGQG